MDRRKHLTEAEVDRLLTATKGARNEARDHCLILLMYRHGLRISEACGLNIDQVDLNDRVLHVSRLKGGLSTTHPLWPIEIKALKAWLAIRKKKNPTTNALFLNKYGDRLGRIGFVELMKRYGVKAGLSLSVHPHMLRHACGYALANQGLDTRMIQDYLGHRSIQNTVRYTATNPRRFDRAWRE